MTPTTNFIKNIGIREFVNRIKSSKQTNNRVFWMEMFLMLIIVLLPFSIYLHKLPLIPSKNVITIFGFDLRMGFLNFQVLTYMIINKMIPIIFFGIWFLTARHWWKPAILLLFSLQIVQLGLVLIDSATVQSINLTVPFLFEVVIPTVIIFGLLLLLVKLFSPRIASTYDLLKVNAEKLVVDGVFFKKNYKWLHESEERLKQDKYASLPKDYLNKLVVITSKFSRRRGELENVEQGRSTRKLFFEILVFSGILILPLLYYSYYLAPEESEVWNFGPFKIAMHGYVSVYVFLWVLMSKVYLFLALSIWFLTSRHWWKFGILIPISVTVIQILDAVNANERYLDEQSFWRFIPVLIPLLLFLTWFSHKLNYFSLSNDLHNELENEIKRVVAQIKQEEDEDIQSQLAALRAQKTGMDPEEYLEKLIALQQQINK